MLKYEEISREKVLELAAKSVPLSVEFLRYVPASTISAYLEYEFMRGQLLYFQFADRTYVGYIYDNDKDKFCSDKDELPMSHDDVSEVLYGEFRENGEVVGIKEIQECAARQVPRFFVAYNSKGETCQTGQ